jgi:DNA-binding NarL/FixJ family response regulator
MDVARLLAGGLSDKEIAGLLGLTVNTVKVMNSRLFDKLRLTSRLEVALWARDHAKLLSVPGIYGQAVNQ